MTVESASYISQLNTAWPLAADLISEGDDHIRLAKTVLKTQFPNFGTTAITVTAAEVNYLGGVTSGIQGQFTGKAPLDSPTFTTAATLPAATTIGTVTAAEISYLSGVTSAIQTQLDGKGSTTGQAWSGAQDFTGATVTVPTATAGDATTKAASTAFVAATAFSAALPGQAGNAGKFVKTDGSAASWAWPELPAVPITTNTTGVAGVRYIIGAPGITLTAPTSWVEGDPFAVSEAITGSTYSIDFGATKVRGVAVGLVTIDAALSGFSMQYKNATLGLI